MKLKLLSLMAASVLLFSCSSTRTTTSSNTAFAVPAIVETSFTNQYAGATNISWNRYDAASVPIDWELTGWPAMDAGDYVVRFDLNNEHYYAWYDSDGNWVGSAYVVSDFKSLPDAVNTTLKNQFPGYTIETVQRELWKDKMAYEIKLKGSGDSKIKLVVDANGTILKQKNKE